MPLRGPLQRPWNTMASQPRGILLDSSRMSSASFGNSASPMKICSGTLHRCDTVRSAAGCSEKMLRREYLKKPEEEIGSAMRWRATSTASSASRVPLLQQPQRHCSRSAESSDTKNSDWQERRWSLHVRRYLLFVLRCPAQYWQCP
jgi:hypothetical protein